MERPTSERAPHYLLRFRKGREMWPDFKVVDARNVELDRFGAIKDGQTKQGASATENALPRYRP